MRRVIIKILPFLISPFLVYAQENRPIEPKQETCQRGNDCTAAMSLQDEGLPASIKEILKRLLQNSGAHPDSEILQKDIRELFLFDSGQEGQGKTLSNGSYSKVYEFQRLNLRMVFYEYKDKKREYRFSLL